MLLDSAEAVLAVIGPVDQYLDLTKRNSIIGGMRFINSVRMILI
jgi:hypothetical protein